MRRKAGKKKAAKGRAPAKKSATKKSARPKAARKAAGKKTARKKAAAKKAVRKIAPKAAKAPAVESRAKAMEPVPALVGGGMMDDDEFDRQEGEPVDLFAPEDQEESGDPGADDEEDGRNW